MPTAPKSDRACPGCGKPATPAATPFCSQGCKDRDLLQWLNEGHRLPGPPADGIGDETGYGADDGLDR